LFTFLFSRYCLGILEKGILHFHYFQQIQRIPPKTGTDFRESFFTWFTKKTWILQLFLHVLSGMHAYQKHKLINNIRLLCDFALHGIVIAL